MKKYDILFWVLLSVILLSCDKNKRKQYSTWIVNGQDTFHTSDVKEETDCNPDHTYCYAVIYSDGPNRFEVSFNTDYFPTTGIYELFIPTSTGIIGVVKIYYNNQYYHSIPYQVDTLYAALHNGKASYMLPAYWFINPNNANDTILVQGTFNEP